MKTYPQNLLKSLSLLALFNFGLLTVTIEAAPVVTVQPVSQTVLEGQNPIISLTATGTPTLVFQWKRGTTNLNDGGGISGSATPTITFSNAAVSQTATNYFCVVTNSSGSVTSRPTALTVLRDLDHDLMGDVWELAYGLNTNNAADALLDNDGDGIINRVEFQQGTNPTNAASKQAVRVVAYGTNSVIGITLALPAGLAQLSVSNYVVTEGSNNIPVVSALQGSQTRFVRLTLGQALLAGHAYTLQTFSPSSQNAMTPNAVTSSTLIFTECPSAVLTNCSGADTTIFVRTYDPVTGVTITFNVFIDGTFSSDSSTSSSPSGNDADATITIPSSLLGPTPNPHEIRISAADGGINPTVNCTNYVWMDTQPPTITCPSPLTVQCDSQVPAALPFTGTVSDDLDPAPAVTLFSETISGVCPRTITRQYKATDACGKTNICTWTITVNDTTPPAVTTAQGANATIQCPTAPSFSAPVFTDACAGVIAPSVVTVTNALGCTNIITRTWTANDGCGNTTNRSQIITVIDTTRPAVTTAQGANVTIQCPAVPSFSAPVFTDACAGVITPSVATVTNALGCTNIITRTWTANDGCGNVTNRSQIITVVDTTGPVITCPTNMFVTTCSSSTMVDYPPVAFSDNCCSLGSVTIGFNPASGSTFSLGATPVSCNATDCCGNISSCTFTVTVTHVTCSDVFANKDFQNNTGQTANGVEWLVQGTFSSVNWHYNGPYNGLASTIFSSFTIVPSGANTLFRWSGGASIPNGGFAHVGFSVVGTSLTTLAVNWTANGVPIGCVHQLSIGPGQVGGGQVVFLNTATNCESQTFHVGNIRLEWFTNQIPLANLNGFAVRNPIRIDDIISSPVPVSPGGSNFVSIPLPPTNANFAMIRYTVSASPTLAGPGNTIDYQEVELSSLPVIIQQPQTQTTGIGSNVTFSVIATGAAPLSYFWQVYCPPENPDYPNCGCIPPVVNQSTLTLTNVSVACAAGYSVIVANASGSVTSQLAYVILPVEVDILLTPGFSHAQATNTLLALGAEIQEDSPYFNTIAFRILSSRLAEVRTNTWILSIQFRQTPVLLNDGSRDSINVRLVQASPWYLPMPPNPYNLSGLGVKAGIWDGGQPGVVITVGVLNTPAHQDIAGRWYPEKSGNPNATHVTHVAGTMAGDGSQSATHGGTALQWAGMAPRAEIHTWDFYGFVFTEMLNGVLASKLNFSQNSWCYLTTFGSYLLECGKADRLVWDQKLPIFFANGNFQQNVAGGFVTVTPPASAKNVVSVGAVAKVTDLIASFSSFGPTLDGRLKPDVVAVGVNVKSDATSGNNYVLNSGTSMACPAVSGLGALLIEKYRQLNSGAFPDPALLKAILCNTATDLGNAGPDFKYGYGKVNAVESAKTLQNGDYVYQAGGIGSNGVHTYYLNVSGSCTNLKVMLVWSDRDYPGTTSTGTATLINDLDLVLFDPSNTQRLPLTLNPALPNAVAVPLANHRDNVEQVVIANPAAGTWRIEVRGFNVPQGPQPYALTWSDPQGCFCLAPPNDACTNAIAVTAGSPAACGTTICATPSGVGTIPAPCGASANAPDVWYTFTPLCSGAVTITTCGLCAGQTSGFDTVLSVYTGACGALTQIVCNDDTGGACGLQSTVTFNGTGGVTYRIRVAGYAGTSGNFRLNVTGGNTPPSNDNCASPIAVTAGSPAACGSTICATASPNGSIPPPCGASASAPDVWYTFTSPCGGLVTIDTCGLCPGQPSSFDTVLSVYTGACGALSQIACNDDTGGTCGLQSTVTFNSTAGATYRIRVAGYAGTSGNFRLNISGGNTPPSNDLCANAIPVSIGSPAACGSTLCATPSATGSIPTPCGSSTTSGDVWYTFTPPCSGPVTINTCGLCTGQSAGFDTVLSVYSGVCGAFTSVACNDDAGGPCGLQSTVTFNATACVTYYIRVAGFAGSSGLFRMNISQTPQAPPNNFCANATVVGNGTYAFNTCLATTDGPTVAGCPQPFNDVWFRYTPTCSGLVWIDTCQSAYDTVLAIYTGPCGSLNLVTCNDDAVAGACSGSLNSYVQFNATAGVTYTIRVGGFAGTTGCGRLNVNGPFPAPGTCVAPSGPAFCRMFRVMGPPNNTSWSWSIGIPCCQNIGNANVPGVAIGGTANTLATAFAASINAACPSGGVTATAINSTATPGLMVVCVSSCTALPTPFVFRVGPAGAAQQNQCVVADVIGNDPLPTTGSCSFNPDIVELPLSGHDCNTNSIDDAIDITTGTSADVNGNGIPDECETCLAPRLTAKPYSQVVQTNDTLTLSVTATGTAPLTYQWSFGAVPLTDGGGISGSRSNTLTIQNITATNLGDYSVTVSNGCGVVSIVPANVSTETLPVPIITRVELLDGKFSLSFEAKLGQTYVVEYKNNLTDPSWTTLETVVGDGFDHSVTDPGPLPNARFYRVRR